MKTLAANPGKSDCSSDATNMSLRQFIYQLDVPLFMLHPVHAHLFLRLMLRPAKEYKIPRGVVVARFNPLMPSRITLTA